MMSQMLGVWRDRASSAEGLGHEKRLAAVRELMIAQMREDAGMHEFDGVVQDLSAQGVASGLAALCPPNWHRRISPSIGADAGHDEAHLRVFENGLRWYLGDYQAHRRNPDLHLMNLDLSCYDREYAPAAARADAKAKHLALWPAAIDVAIETLDSVSAPVAQALLGSARGLAAPLLSPGDGNPIAGPRTVAAALAAHGRLVEHLETIAATGDPSASVGPRHLAAFMGAFDGVQVNLRELADRADSERTRIQALMTAACARLDPHTPTREVVARLLLDHPAPDDVLPAARALTAEAIAFTREHQLAPWVDGECLVGPAPPSRQWAVAMMAISGPYEDDSSSWFWVTPPDPSWPQTEIDEWLSIFSATTLPAIAIHEVAPGHFAHFRALRRVPSPVRRQLWSMAFVEGWAHYAEEIAIEAGFHSGDPRFAIGVYHEALVRVTRLTAAIALHTGVIDVDGAAALFESDALLAPAAARSEAARGTFDVDYGRYTVGKLDIMALRRRAESAWGPGFSLPRFHTALMQLGAPPLSLIPAIL